jgi:Spy/CpxP family protein refolding chaperone
MLTKSTVMADNKDLRDQRDRARVSENDSYELSFLEEKLGKTREEIREAIKAVGSDRKKVEEYLTTRRSQE